MAPKRLGLPRLAVEQPRRHEQEVGQPVEIRHELRALDGLGLAQRDDAGLGAAADGARDVAAGRGRRAARQDELLQRPEPAVELGNRGLEPLEGLLADTRMRRQAELGADLEQVLLHVSEAVGDLGGHALREHQADPAVQLVDGAEREDARARLRDAVAGSEAGGALVAGARGDLAEAVGHGYAA
jgi:hypothetical protein